MGLLDVFFRKKRAEPVEQKPRTGFRNKRGEELTEYLTENDVGLLNYAVDGNGGVTGSVTDLSDYARVHGALDVWELGKLSDRLVDAGLTQEDADRLTGIVARWAMGVKR